MKGLVTVSTGSVVNILMSGKDMPEVGHYYILEDATHGTGSQNRAFHALTMEYFKSGMHSYTCDNYDDFRNQIKKTLGAGFEGFVYACLRDDSSYCDTPILKHAKTKEDIPMHIRDSDYFKEMIFGKLKSWSDYTLKERKNTIDNLLAEMDNAGVNSKKYQEIREGMQHETNI